LTVQVNKRKCGDIQPEKKKGIVYFLADFFAQPSLCLKREKVDKTLLDMIKRKSQTKHKIEEPPSHVNG